MPSTGFFATLLQFAGQLAPNTARPLA